jgi:hypothetical protein
MLYFFYTHEEPVPMDKIEDTPPTAELPKLGIWSRVRPLLFGRSHGSWSVQAEPLKRIVKACL